jgi:caa(3)-type oxidase subunit IV
MTETRRIVYTWAALSVITIVTWGLAHAPSRSGEQVLAAVTIAVLGIAVVKARLIIRNFMEVRSAPRWLRAFTDIWLVALAAAIVVVYFWPV